MPAPYPNPYCRKCSGAPCLCPCHDREWPLDGNGDPLAEDDGGAHHLNDELK